MSAIIVTKNNPIIAEAIIAGIDRASVDVDVDDVGIVVVSMDVRYKVNKGDVDAAFPKSS